MGEPKAKKPRHQLSLLIQPRVPQFPYIDQHFDVTVYLFDDSNQVKSGDDFDIPLQVRLMFNDKPRTFVDKDILEVEPQTPHLGKAGKVTFRVRIRDVSMSFDNREFCLHVQALSRPGKFVINPIISDAMTVVRYRLVIRRDSQPPAVWFKDEGGRDKCIEIVTELVDGDGRRVRGQEVPLKVSLLYEDMHLVTKQDILKLSSDTRQYIDETGVATLRLRIEDVSKNHQSKGFVIRVAPDTQHSPLNFDISPDFSTSISVRSKRNRRNKGGKQEDDTGVVGARHTMGGGIDLATLPVENPLQDAAPIAAPVEPMDLAADPMHKALSSVVNWTRAVVNGLYQIQWQLIGYETKADGTPDIQRPLFNITNPNAIVTSILQTYRNDTMDNLRFMVQSLENASTEGIAPPHHQRQQQQQQQYYGGQQQGYAKDGQQQQQQEEGYGAAANGTNGGRGGQGSEGGEAQVMGQQGYNNYSGDQGSSGGQYGGNDSGGVDHGDAPPRPPMLGNPSAPVYDHGPGGGGGPAISTLGLHSTMSTLGGNMPVPQVPANFSFSRPSLLRGKSTINTSFLSDMDILEPGGFPMLPLVRENTFDLLAGMDASWFADGEGGAPGQSHLSIENQVHYMVAKVYFSNAFGELGFPAFDHKHNLLGFYKEGRNEQGQTVAFYIPLPPSFSDMEKKEVSMMLQKELREGTGAVAQIANNDLAQLKERVLTYHWSRSQQPTSSSSSSYGQHHSLRQASSSSSSSSSNIPVTAGGAR